MTKYLGHSENDHGRGIAETLDDHVRAVAATASRFGEPFSASESAEAAAWLHDLGKFADQMQLRLRGKDPRGRDHWSAGTLVALNLFSKLAPNAAVPIAAAIQGHHVGLEKYWSNPGAAGRAIAQKMLDEPDDFTDNNVGQLLERHQAEGFPVPKVNHAFVADSSLAGSMFDTRMLFSTLVDADFLETEAHFEGDADIPRRYREPLPSLDFAKALSRVTAYVDRLDASGDVDVQQMRTELFQTCLTAGQTVQPGIYTLSAPTGAGKTLGMLAFALAHAANNQNRVSRIVLSMPFLNIIDQTAREYRSLFSQEFGFDPACILEDHSTAEANIETGNPDDNGPSDQLRRTRRMAAENWDASVVLTTNVKLLESLHANRPARCRKLHRLANSVILFDEVQSIPPKLVKPTLATLAHFAHRYQSTIVFATATQPAFDHLSADVVKISSRSWKPTAIVKANDWMFDVAARRINVDWRIEQPTAWSDIAHELNTPEADQSVCIVNLKRHAQHLLKLLADKDRPGLLHLSTNMCQVHRASVLAQVSKALAPDSEEPICLVSTQCIEAGINLDSPVMYRALAPLESISQAAGRCNRHGKRTTQGRVVVFKPEDDGRVQYPPGGYGQAATATETFLRQLQLEYGDLNRLNVLNNSELIRQYYRQFYDLNRTATEHRDLMNAIEAGDFSKVAEHYRLIPGGQISILVPYDRQAFEELRDRLNVDHRGPGFVRKWITDARQHAVSIHRPKQDDNLWCHLQPVQFNRQQHVDNDTADWFVLLNETQYDPTLGLRTEVEFATTV